MRNYKTKEKEVVDQITQTFADFTWVADKKVFDGCSRRRPDLLLDLGSHVVIIEIDEDKHTGYECSCENKRIMQISQDLHHRPVVFIRFNPDEYITPEGEYWFVLAGNSTNWGLFILQKTNKPNGRNALMC